MFEGTEMYRQIFAIFIMTALLVGCNEDPTKIQLPASLNPGSKAQPSTIPDSNVTTIVDTKTYSATVSWAANRETKVNGAGGGYRVTYSKDLSFPVGQSAVADVPWVSGTLAPTSFPVSGLGAGTYYFKVQAFSELGTSESSIVIPLTVP